MSEQTCDATVSLLKRRQIDCVFEKKKHFNAASRKRKYHFSLSMTIIAISVTSGSMLLAKLAEFNSQWATIIPLLFSFLVALLSGAQEFLSFHKQIEGHSQVANVFLKIAKDVDSLLALINDNVISTTDLSQRIDAINSQIDKANKLGESFPTSQADYSIARKGISDGEETYTPEDYTLWS